MTKQYLLEIELDSRDGDTRAPTTINLKFRLRKEEIAVVVNLLLLPGLDLLAEKFFRATVKPRDICEHLL